MSTPTNNGIDALKDVQLPQHTIGEMKKFIGTHNGTFHCDEILACYMLRTLPEYEKSEIVRSRNIEMLRDKCHIIVDVGSEFDHERKWYDHHQNSFNSTLSSLRPDLGTAEFQIRLSSAGLIYAYYGERVIANILQREANVTLSDENLKLCYVQVYRNFISEIDAIDNGVPMYEKEDKPRYKIHTHISGRISRFNPSWEHEGLISDSEIDELFHKAMVAVGQEFVANVMAVGNSWIRARELVREALLKAPEVYPTGEILLLEKFCPWKAHLGDLELQHQVVGIPKLVVYQDSTDSWRVNGVPISPDSFVGRKFLPKCWRGLRNEELSQVAGVPDLVFAHHTGFIGGALNKESALAMAIKSVGWTTIDAHND